MKDKKTNPNFMNGVPEFLALSLLTKGEMYGYELVKKIRESTHGTLYFQEGCIYPTLHSLEGEGCLTSTRKEVNGRRRFYYQLTPKGKRKLERMTTEWATVVRGISIALRRPHAEPATA